MGEHTMLTAENQRLLEAIQKGICILDAQGLVLAANTPSCGLPDAMRPICWGILWESL